MKNFKSKRRFYKKFLGLFLLWLILPLFLVLIAFGVSPMGWPAYTFVWESILIWISQYCLLVMYNPIANQYNKNYPFHQDNLPYLTNIPWKTAPTLRSIKSRKELGPLTHVLSGTSTAANINILEIYQAIRDSGQGMIGACDTIIPKMNLFKDILEDWDVEVDRTEDDVHQKLK